MKVFKFGGASVNSTDRIKNVGAIIKDHQNGELLVIISAMGKTTNALEKVVEAFYAGRQQEALQLFSVIKQSHLDTARFLLVTTFNDTLERLTGFFTEVEWLLHDKPVRDFDYYYDQVVCIGELLSTCIVSAYMNEVGIVNTWLDVRDLLRTDNNFRDAAVDFKTTAEKALPTINWQQTRIYITQGFVGSTDENESTTLGREGSDYTAAIFSGILKAESLTIWKDVEGVMSADPKLFTDAIWLNELSYMEVIEMAYYGAQVIHPKTIKPLQNGNIPLHVRSFINPVLPGTVISNKNVKNLPPIKVIKQNQALIHLQTRDFSFASEAPITILEEILASLKIKPNLLQTGAITIEFCLDDRSDKIDHLALNASETFNVQVEKGLTLLTIRHCNNEVLNEMLSGKDVVLRQQTKETVQVLYK